MDGCPKRPNMLYVLLRSNKEIAKQDSAKMSETTIMREWYHQPFHGEMQCGSLACTHEHISFHNLGMGIYDNFPVNVFSCATLG